MSNRDLIAHAQRTAAELGAAVFPVCVEPDAKRPGKTVKRPLIKHWPTAAAREPEAIKRLFQKHPNATHAGIVTGNGLLVVDFDGEEAQHYIVDNLDLFPTTREQPTLRAGGMHVYYRLPEGTALRNSASKLAPGVDIRADGGFVVDWSIDNPPTSRAIVEAPAALIAKLQAPVQPAAAEPTRSHAAGDAVGEGGRNDYLAREAGRLRNLGYDAATLEGMLATINDAKCEPPLDAEEVRQIARSVARYEPKDINRPADPEEFDPIEIPETPARFVLIPAHVFAGGKAPDWIVKGVLPRAELVVLFGESGSGKSFFALDLIAAIARGIPWRGKTVRQGRIVYIVAEGIGGMRNRLKAYGHQHGVALDSLPVSIISDAPNLLKGDDALALAKQIKSAGSVAVIVVDTLSAVTPGGNENAGEDMGTVLAHCKGLHRATGALVLLIHHSGKDQSKGARGWSGLRAAADAELEITRLGDARIATISKQKDADDGAAFAFKLLPVEIGTDEDGEPVTSCVIEHIDKLPAKPREPKGTVQRTVYRMGLDLLPIDGPRRVTVAKLFDSCVPLLSHDPQRRDYRCQRIKRAIDSLQADNFIAIDGEDVVIL